MTEKNNDVSRRVSFIEFRHKVDDMIRNGELKTIDNIIAYAIKSREAHEVNYRVSHGLLSYYERHQENRASAWRIFDSEHGLEEDDMAFFFDSLTDSTFPNYFLGMVEDYRDDLILNESIRSLLRYFFERVAVSSQMSSYALSRAVCKPNFTKLFAHVYEDDPSACEIYQSIFEKSDGVLSGNYFKSFLMVMSIKEDFGYLAEADGQAYQQEGFKEILSIAYIERFIAMEKLVSTNGSYYGFSENHAISMMSEYASVLDSFMAVAKHYDQDVAQKLLGVFRDRIETLSDLLLSRFKRKPKMSFSVFTKNPIMNRTDNNTRLASEKVLHFSEMINDLPLQDDRKRQLSQVLIGVVSKNMYAHNPYINKAFSNLSNLVDWKEALDGASNEERAFIVNNTVGINAVTPYLTSEERGRRLEQELSL